MTLGTVAYAAPEQLLGEEIDSRADQYALAATAFHLLTGAQLFPHSNPAVVIGRHLNTPPPTLADARMDLVGLDSALQMALAKDPADRFPTCAAFARALEGGMGSEAATSPHAPTVAALRSQKPQLRAAVNSRRRYRVASIIAAASVILLGLGVFGGRSLHRLEPTPTETTSSAAAEAPQGPATTTTPTTTNPALPAPATSSSTMSQVPLPSPPPATPTSTTVADEPADEAGFLKAARTLPMYVRLDRYGGDAGLIAQGYKACAALDEYPNDPQQATRAIYPQGNDVYGSITMDGDMMMLYSASYLCPRHAHLYDNY